LDDQGRWQAFEPGEMTGMLADFGLPWWIAGGCAIDLFVGRTTREHDDLDVALPLLSDDQREWLRCSLETWNPDHEWLARISG
jgi:hypothetical protein